MKIVLLSAANSIHTIRWANGLAQKGLDVYLISTHALADEFRLHSSVSLYILKTKAPLGYVLAAWELKSLLRKIKPDILNAHYASGYGLLARLSGFHPLLLSVWGSDVYDFPNKSFLARCILKANLKNADAIASTSHCMAQQTAKTYLHPHCFITPFGIDIDIFKPTSEENTSDVIQVGTVKTLSEKYGIDTLIETFALLVNERKDKAFHLTIAGGGADEHKLKTLTQALNIQHQVTFTGFIAHEKVPDLLNQLDIYVALSREESFGVAILEANACAKPVVVSDAEGLKEVVKEGKTGFVVPKNNPQAAKDALVKLIDDADLRKTTGQAGSHHVMEHYTWEHSLELMIDAYKKTLEVVKK